MNMRFKSFVWPNNPHTCSLTTKRDVVTYKYPGGAYRLADLGPGSRVLTGEGEFFGEEAYETMLRLLDVFQEGGTGALVHPVLRMDYAIFSELELTQEPRKDYVRYRFVFQEAVKKYGGEDVVWESSYRAGGNESLWDVAAACGTTADQLMALNPGITNVNRLDAGVRVQVR